MPLPCLVEKASVLKRLRNAAPWDYSTARILTGRPGGPAGGGDEVKGKKLGRDRAVKKEQRNLDCS